jgi:tetratricopeptide (TPR) repeat protein
MKKFAFPLWSVPLALLGICLISFGVLAPWLGFYWDDWPSIWYLHLFGPTGFLKVFAVDRPALGWLFTLTSSLMGTSPLAWQLFGVFTRWLSCIALWWALRTIWPRNTREVTWVAFLYAVYPGFQQQYIAVTYSHDWLILSLFFTSFSLMVLALRQPQRFWLYMGASWLLAAYVMFADEYYFGLELLRPVFLWLLTTQQGLALRQRIQRVLRVWLPFVAIMVLFLVWRLFILVSPRGNVQLFDRISAKPVSSIAHLVITMLTEAFKSSFGAWAEPFQFSSFLAAGQTAVLIYAIVVLFTALAAVVYLFGLRFPATNNVTLEDNRSSSMPWSLQAISIGCFALLMAGWPFWVTNLPIDLRFPWDRFTLSMMLGASLLFGGLIELVTRAQWQRVILLGLALALAAGLHFNTANEYRKAWNLQKTFFWQLTWRAPGIQPGTLLLTAQLPFIYYSDNSLSAPLNWVYAPNLETSQMPYMMYALESRLGVSLPELQANIPIQQSYRATEFSGNTSQALGVYFIPPGCVRVLDPQVDRRLPARTDRVLRIVPYSDVSRINLTTKPGAIPPLSIFGPEPAHDWCYDFEKADLARQQGDWEQVAQLADHALKPNPRLYEANGPELVTFILGYAHTGQWKKAQALTDEATKINIQIRNMLCFNWRQIERDTQKDDQQQAAIAAVNNQLRCNP